MTPAEHLRKLLAAGWEWPDATAKVATQHGISQEALSAAYDVDTAARIDATLLEMNGRTR